MLAKITEDVNEISKKIQASQRNVRELESLREQTTQMFHRWRQLDDDTAKLETDVLDAEHIIEHKNIDVEDLIAMNQKADSELNRLIRANLELKEEIDHEIRDAQLSKKEYEPKIFNLKNETRRLADEIEIKLSETEKNKETYDALYAKYDTEKLKLDKELEELQQLRQDVIELRRIEERASEKSKCKREERAYNNYEMNNNVKVLRIMSQDFQAVLEKLQELEEACDQISKENKDIIERLEDSEAEVSRG